MLVKTINKKFSWSKTVNKSQLILFLLIFFITFLPNQQCLYAAKEPLTTNVNQLTQSLTLLRNKLIELATQLQKTKDAFGEEELASKTFFGQILVNKGAVEQEDTVNNTKFYKIKVLAQNGNQPNYNTHGAQELDALKKGYGCSFHAQKNALYICKILLEQGDINTNREALSSVPIFLHLFEAPLKTLLPPETKSTEKTYWKYRWPNDRGAQSWFPVSSAFRVKLPHLSVVKKWWDLSKHGPPATEKSEIDNLIEKIKEGQALAPDEASIKITKNIKVIQAVPYILSNSYATERKKNFYPPLQNEDINKSKEALKDAKEKLKKNKSLLMPLLISWEHVEGRHWVAVIINKIDEKFEIFYADSWVGSHPLDRITPLIKHLTDN
ncbi:MAG: Ulp1 family isopeptidase [bacterium]